MTFDTLSQSCVLRIVRKLRSRFSRSQEQPLVYSELLDSVHFKPFNCFTTLPCRVHRRNNVALTGAQRFQREWAAIENKTPGPPMADSPIGYMSSLFYPDCLPERLELCAFLLELICLIDDMDDENAFHDKTSVPSILGAMQGQPVTLPRDAAIQELSSKYLLDVLKAYGKEGEALIQRFRVQWVEYTSNPIGQPTSFDDYMRRRLTNFGKGIFWGLLDFSLGILLTPEETKLIQPLTDIACRIMAETNDYFSWEVECLYDDGQISNAVRWFMTQDGISADQGKETLKKCIIADEHKYQLTLEEFHRSHPSLPMHLRRYVAATSHLVAGNHYWSAVCYRYDPRRRPCKKQIASLRVEKKAFSAIMERERESQGQLSIDPGVGPKVSLLPDDVILDNSALLAPQAYIQSLPSKNVRLKLVNSLNVWYKISDEQANLTKAVVNDLHNASLILDDIQDESLLRRGSSTAHCIFGTAQSINTATYMVVQAASRIFEEGGRDGHVMDSFLSGVIQLCRGQSWDLNWKFNTYCPSASEYMAMVDGKTGAMFTMVSQMMRSMSSQPSLPINDLDRLTMLLGRWFQVVDDYKNLYNAEYTEQKGFCEDLDEGKLSLPVILCCKMDPIAHTIIMGIFRQKAKGMLLTNGTKLQILNFIRNSGALEETRRVIQQLEREFDETLCAIETATGIENESLRLTMRLLGGTTDSN